jgi:hypothetical protein
LLPCFCCRCCCCCACCSCRFGVRVRFAWGCSCSLFCCLLPPHSRCHRFLEFCCLGLELGVLAYAWCDRDGGARAACVVLCAALHRFSRALASARGHSFNFVFCADAVCLAVVILAPCGSFAASVTVVGVDCRRRDVSSVGCGGSLWVWELSWGCFSFSGVLERWWGLYLVVLLVVGVGVDRPHVNSSARVKAEVGGLGGKCLCYSLHHVCDRPTVCEEMVSLTVCNPCHEQLFWCA